MALETGTYISDLVTANPTGADPKSSADDHLRLLKSVLKNSFTGITGAVTVTQNELNYMAGATTQPAMKDGSNLTTPTLGDSSTKIATTAFVATAAFAASLPAISAPVAGYFVGNDGVVGGWSNLLRTGVIRIADSADPTKLIAIAMSSITTGTTRTVTFGDRDIDLSASFLHVRDEKATGTDGGNSVAGVNVRTLNAVVSNTIVGASLAGSLVTLPAGTYDFVATAPGNGGGSSVSHRLNLYNDTDASTIMVGVRAFGAGGGGGESQAICSGRFTITATKNIKLNHYLSSSIATTGLGAQINRPGEVEVFASLQLWKVA